MNSRTLILDDIRASLGRTVSSPVAPRPPIVPPRVARPIEQEIEKLMVEVNALKGNARRVASSDLNVALRELVRAESVRCAVLWHTPRLRQVDETFRTLGVEIIPHDT